MGWRLGGGGTLDERLSGRLDKMKIVHLQPRSPDKGLV